MTRIAMDKWKQACRLILPGLIAAAVTHESLAQSYPSRPVRILTSSAGNSSDFAARTIARELTSSFGQSVLVENRGSGFALNVAVATAAPDGHTLLVVGGTLWIGPLIETAPYDVNRDFAPIAILTRAPNILLVHPSLPARSVAELIKLAKARPGQLNHSSGQVGSSSHLAGELLKSLANIDIVLVKYRVSQQQMTDLMAGEVQLTFQGGATLAGLVKAGKVRALASGSAKRSALYPDLPAVAETLPGFVSESVLTFWGPGKTPDIIVRRLTQDTVRALEKPQVRDHLLTDGQEAVGAPAEQLRAYVAAEVARIGKLIKDLGTQPGG
jgi:tripartite-type tricarboxylate transporter receptor subunit TctC